MNDNSLSKLLQEIEPKVHNIEDNRVEVKALRDVFNTMQELIELSKTSYNEIFHFYDQDFIIRAIKIGNQNYNELIRQYESAKYLLENNNSNLKELPQYKEALDYINYLYQYLSGLYEKINLDFTKKREDLEIKELLNKYYRILLKKNTFIEDIDEFITFIEFCNIDDVDKLNIYRYIYKLNIKQYTKSMDIKLDDEVTLTDVENLLKRNKELYQNNYLKEDIKLDDYLLNNDVIEESYFENRKIYLYNVINEYYETKKYIEITDYYKEFNKIIELQQEFKKQKVMPKELLFIMDNDESLVRRFIDNTEIKYKNCILKNLLDIENENVLTIHKKKYEKNYIYEKDEFVVKTIYTYLENGKILILGVLSQGENLNDFFDKNKDLFNKSIANIETVDLVNDERDLILNNINIDDLMLNIDLETLDVKREDKNAR